MFKARRLAAGFWLFSVVIHGPLGATAGGDRPTFHIGATAEGIRIDGVLDEAQWQSAPTFELGYESYPSDNTPAPQRTEVWLAFDDESLYVAFRAFDSSPSEIRARFRERDGNSVNDDSVGIAIDPFDDGRRAFKFYSTSLGVQTDFIVDEVARANDYSWDTHWRSAGRIGTHGYDVELAIPLSALRYPAHQGEQVWGIDAVRLRPRKDFGSSRNRVGDFRASRWLGARWALGSGVFPLAAFLS